MKALQQKGIYLSTKVKVHNAKVLSSLSNECETWTLYLKKLQQFHQTSLHSIMHICWQEFITNDKVLSRVESTSAEAMIRMFQLWWSGHVIRMENYHIPKELGFFCEFVAYCPINLSQQHLTDLVEGPLSAHQSLQGFSIANHHRGMCKTPHKGRGCDWQIFVHHMWVTLSVMLWALQPYMDSQNWKKYA